MESLQSLKTRLKSVKNIGQITKAMELVAATKMRRSQEIALASRPYVFAALDLLANVTRFQNVTMPPLLSSRPVTKTAYVIVTSDKGLAGSFNSAVFRELEKYAKREGIDFADPNNTFFAVGQKTISYLTRSVGDRLRKFTRVGDYTTIAEVAPLADMLVNGFLAGEFDRVVAISTHFRSALKQEVLVRQILPATIESLQKTAQEIVPETGKFADLVKAHALPLFQKDDKQKSPGNDELDYLIEPSPTVILDSLAQHLIVMELYHLVLEANASEHAARRMAMKSASDNAKDLSDKLAIQYNKSRQAGITREILEITAGAESLK